MIPRTWVQKNWKTPYSYIGITLEMLAVNCIIPERAKVRNRFR